MKPALLLLTLAGGGFVAAKVLSKKKRKTKKASGPASRVLYTSDPMKTLEFAKSNIDKRRCTVVCVFRKGLIAPWKAAALRLAAEYPHAFWVGTSTLEAVAHLAENEDWRLAVWIESSKAESGPAYSSTGTDLDAMALEMENAVLHCDDGS